ncbi:sedoheptulose 7-phosphate cyclase [Roseobacter weihaiensis]|uniref:sedoheptulose 7-phosphate cyclase n=1 Tax=Roseobacter weihaiensis TaxID=2763262 RepID=UPI001D0B30B3|nr:sedoheptulose 7-phosphate cyclase [Roseobacter sp. H9]
MQMASVRENLFRVELIRELGSPQSQTWMTENLSHYEQIFAVTTPTVDAIYGSQIKKLLGLAGVPLDWHVLASGESSKTMDAVMNLCQTTKDAGVTRCSALVAVGGGVCMDIASFTASMLRRGIAHVRIPTTLIGQIDAGIGLKGGVNFGCAKNYLGCFYPPAAVAVFPEFLKTLDRGEIEQGVAEMIKVAITSDPELFELIEETGGSSFREILNNGGSTSHDPIAKAIAAMMCELEQNPYETKGYERAVDFGHTIAHPLEAASNFSVRHGDAVAIDMAFSCRLAWRLGLLDESTMTRILRILMSVNLPVWHDLLDPNFVRNALKDAANHRGGMVNMVLPVAIGQYSFLKTSNEISDADLVDTLAWLRQTQKLKR